MNRLKNEPSFIRLLRENTGIKAAVYVIILSFVVFFGLLIATWVMRYRSQRVYYGPKCVYTSLVNNAETTEHSSLELIQREYANIEGKLMEPEVLTFQYANGDMGQQSFYVTINTDFPSGVPEQYPPGISESGICVKAGGVSVYIKHYDNQTSWTGAVQVVDYGMSVYLDEYVNTGPVTATVCASVKYTQSDEVILYSTYHYSSSGPNSVSTNATGTSPSFFLDFTSTINKIYITPIQTDTSSYDPFDDFIKTKQSIKGSEGCASNNDNCRCTDPGAKNLPSCNSPYVSGKGYLVSKTTGNEPTYSKNCTHSNVKNLQNPITNSGTQPGDEGSKGPQAYSQMVPKGSTLSNAIVRNTKNPSNYEGMDTNSKFGTTKFPGNLSQKYKNSFPSDYIFCGSGVSSNPGNFTTFNLGTGARFVPANGNTGEAMSAQLNGSSVPNAGSNFQLGYSGVITSKSS
jgi:hypothetical protein